MSASWLIEAVNPEKEAVHLVKAGTGIRRKFSVPGALHAWMDGDFLFIASSTGYVWQVTPNNGHRRRDMRPTHLPHKAPRHLPCPAC